MVSEDVIELQRLTQRVCAAADQVDRRLESPASAHVIAAARALFAAVDHVVAREQYVAASAAQPGALDLLELPVAAEPERDWPQAGDEVVVEVSAHHQRCGRVRFCFLLRGEPAVRCQSKQGDFEALVEECKRP